MTTNPVIQEFNATSGRKTDRSGTFKGAIDEDSAQKVSSMCGAGWEKSPLENGELPLHYALRIGKTNAATEMLKQTPDIDLSKKDISGLTPWDHAAISGNKDSLFVLLAHKMGNLLAKIKSIFETPLSSLQKAGIERLIDKTQKDYLKDLKGPIHLAAARGDLEAISELCKNSTDANLQTKEGFTPLHYAALSGNVKAMELLIQKGASIDLLSNERMSALHMAAIGDSKAATEYLIKQGLSFHAIDVDGSPPLHYAVCKEGLNAAAVLIQAGAPIETANFNQIDALFGLVNVIKVRSERRDPLFLPTKHKLLFSSIILSHLANYIQDPKLNIISILFQEATIDYIGLKDWKSQAFLLGNYLLNTWNIMRSIENPNRGPTVLSWAANAAESTWRTWAVFCATTEAIRGIANAYKEGRKYETFRPIRNTIFYMVNGTQSLYNYLRFLPDISFSFRAAAKPNPEDVCSKFETKDECILADQLNPNFESHAAWILGIDPGTDCKDVQKAYKKMARLKHPDKCDVSMKEKCTKIFQNLNQAHQRLCSKKWQDYDESWEA